MDLVKGKQKKGRKTTNKLLQKKKKLSMSAPLLKRTAKTLEDLSRIGPLSTEEELSSALYKVESLLKELQTLKERETTEVRLYTEDQLTIRYYSCWPLPTRSNESLRNALSSQEKACC